MRKLFVALLLLSQTAFAQVNLNQGLIAYYPFNGNSNDETGNGYHGTPLNGVQLTTDRFGNLNSAYSFDGINDRIMVSDNGGLSPSSLTIACYFNADIVAQQMIIGKIDFFNGDGATYNMGAYNNSGATASFSIYNENSPCNIPVPSTLQYSLSAPFSPGTNSWHCAIGTFENSVLKFYIDGILMSTDSYSFNNAKNCTNTDLIIGSWWSGQLIPFKGKIDDIRIYNRAINQAEVSALCDQTANVSCTNWLKIPNALSGVTIGDLDIIGNQITVEALCNATTIYDSSRALVSKHRDASDVNYFLCPDLAQISTSTGFFSFTSPCGFISNKTYHVAMVYNGSSLKLYRNGFLMGQIPATGNLVTNNWPATIGEYAYSMFASQSNVSNIFKGYINEVRIWNVERNQSEIQAYMNVPLPNPDSQTGLQGYYSFENLSNKQGNSSFTATLKGAASINNINPNCDFAIDSCPISTPVILRDFRATVIENKKLLLQWDTDEEFDIEKYIIQRSVDGANNFINIGSMQAFSNSRQNQYSFVDDNLLSNGLYHYRLQIQDQNGERKYSPIISGKIISSKYPIATVYPNPVHSNINIQLNTFNSNTEIKLFNNLGQCFVKRKSNFNCNFISLDLRQYPPGIYWLVITNDSGRLVKKIFKN